MMNKHYKKGPDLNLAPLSPIFVATPLHYHKFCPYSNYDILISSPVNYIVMCDRYHSIIHEK